MVRLIRADVRLPTAAIAGDDRLAAALDHPVVPGWATFPEALRRTRDGVVELGYEIAESHRRRGLATAAARAMVADAFADDRVTRLIAHTLPEPNASTRVLERVGFRFDTEARERGAVVWRVALSRGAVVSPPAR